MKRIMIISADYTGHGHKSISEAVIDHLQDYPDAVWSVVDGFSLIGNAGVFLSKFYGPITRNAKELWKMSFALLDQHPGMLRDPMREAIHDRFLRKLRTFAPDLIVTVHPFFNGSVKDILDLYDLDIPLIALQADIINIHGAWCDPAATLTLCPTQEAYQFTMQRGMPPEKLRVVGFPTRRRFTDAAKACSPQAYTSDRPLNCLMMSGGEGSGKLLEYAEQLLMHTNVRLSVICGRNQKLKSELEETLLARYSDKLTVLGFVEDVQNVMGKSDLVIARGSPNTLMEAVVLAVPLLITGSLPGQEADNPALMVAHNLGVICDHPKFISLIVRALTANNGARLREIRAAQIAYRNLDAAHDIAKLLYDMAVPKERAFPRKAYVMTLTKGTGKRKAHHLEE